MDGAGVMMASGSEADDDLDGARDEACEIEGALLGAMKMDAICDTDGGSEGAGEGSWEMDGRLDES